MEKVRLDLDIPKVDFDRVDRRIKSLAGEVREKMEKLGVYYASIGDEEGFIAKIESKTSQRKVMKRRMINSGSRSFMSWEDAPLLEEAVAYVEDYKREPYEDEDILGVLEFGMDEDLSKYGQGLSFESSIFILKNEWVIWDELEFFSRMKS